MDEAKLIAGLKKGDARCYETLFQRFYGKFVQFVNCILQDKDAARDIVQDAFIRVYDNRERLQEGLSIENYLYVIVKRLMMNFIRDRKWHADITNQLIDNQLITQLGGGEEAVFAHDTRSLVREEVARMPAQRKKCYLLSREQGLSNKEIAEQLGLSVRTVERHITLALSQIRKNFS